MSAGAGSSLAAAAGHDMPVVTTTGKKIDTLIATVQADLMTKAYRLSPNVIGTPGTVPRRWEVGAPVIGSTTGAAPVAGVPVVEVAPMPMRGSNGAWTGGAVCGGTGGGGAGGGGGVVVGWALVVVS